MNRRVLLIYFSWRGATKRVALDIKRMLEEKYHLEVYEIKPMVEYGYFGWLIRSFIPNSRVPIHPLPFDLTRYDLIYLGLPKWAFSCPPINEYLHLMSGAEGKMFKVFLTYGGFDEDRYLKAFVRKLRSKGINVVTTLKVKRSRIGGEDYLRSLNDFVSNP
ncbi:MAG: hypothetical protein RMJ31_02250 [Nitrososphaerota archaeon]|nr:hypothetical protein [Nitrososphaerales archaeon]MCX8191817.1 hypothetical protein [Nitrososphaerales archaeon]MDW8044583.1 hypothetical protein [Nitrososphaerota archaeon]